MYNIEASLKVYPYTTGHSKLIHYVFVYFPTHSPISFPSAQQSFWFLNKYEFTFKQSDIIHYVYLYTTVFEMNVYLM